MRPPVCYRRPFHGPVLSPMCVSPARRDQVALPVRLERQKAKPAAWVLPLSRFRDWLPSRHGRPARHLAPGFMASEWLEHAGRYGAPQGDRACRTLPRLAGARRHRARATSTGWRATDALARARRSGYPGLGKGRFHPLGHAPGGVRTRGYAATLTSLSRTRLPAARGVGGHPGTASEAHPARVLPGSRGEWRPPQRSPHRR